MEPWLSVSLKVMDWPAVTLTVQVKEVPVCSPKSMRGAAETCPPGMMELRGAKRK